MGGGGSLYIYIAAGGSYAGRRMTGSAGGVYGARRSVSLNIQKNGGLEGG